MKILTEEQVAGHNGAIFRGAAEGLVGSAALALPAFYALNRKWAYYRSLPLTLKCMGAVMVIAPCISIQAERRGLEFDREVNWTGAGRMELDRAAAEEEARWRALPMKDKVADWAARHQYGIIFGSWALSMAVAGAIIARDRYQTVPQKVVQARVWAQGLTVGVLLVAGALTHSQRQEAIAQRRAPVDHSWQTFVRR
ncbi:hypothetical protein ID866_4336 [Astraeus odoratus]|nr:hypothetical protein ID866_4336 [Astraeus odoratus]